MPSDTITLNNTSKRQLNFVQLIVCFFRLDFSALVLLQLSFNISKKEMENMFKFFITNLVDISIGSALQINKAWSDFIVRWLESSWNRVYQDTFNYTLIQYRVFFIKITCDAIIGNMLMNNYQSSLTHKVESSLSALW